MKIFVQLVAVLIFCHGLRAAELSAMELQVAEAVKSRKVTVVHLWASWCPNCEAEFRGGGWKKFVDANPSVNFIFVTVRDEKDGAAVLAKYGLSGQTNFGHFQHPNSSRHPDSEMTSFLGQRVGWIPVTWVFCNGRLRFALNYGQIRFPILQQLVEDALPKWD